MIYLKAKFVISMSRNGGYVFVMKAPNGKVICQSEVYSRRRNAVKGIKSIQKFAKGAVIVNAE